MMDIGKDLQNAYDDGYKQRDSEIVRCEQCKWHLNKTHTCTMFYFCGMYTRDDFYCADGKREEQ